jgi:hypothetical protein
MPKKLYRRHNLLLQDAQVKAWYDEVCLGSEMEALCPTKNSGR